ncbi:zinc finger, CCHC-type containing protein [Tanacetum coccineum]
MGDENPIRTLGDYSKTSHEGYRNTIELPEGNNVVPFRSDTIRLVQNGCSFHELRSEDPNQHLKDFLKLVDSLDLDGSISTWKDLTTRFLAQFFPPRMTAKLRNDILMLQQHHGESLSEACTRFKDLLQKVPHHGIDRWLQIQIFYDHVSRHLKCEIDRVAGVKLRNKDADESWEIIKDLALFDHEGGDETKEFVKPVKAISTPQGVSKTPDRRLLELEDQINFLLKGSRPTPAPSSAHIPKLMSKHPQPQALDTTFKARVRDCMAAHTERMERFKNIIFKQREEFNGRMTEMFGLLKELTTSKTPKKVLVREGAIFPITKNVISISLTKEEEGSNRTKLTPDNTKKLTETETETPVIEVERMNEVESGAKNKSIKTSESKEAVEALGSDVNVIPYVTYMKLTDERPAETDIRLSLASHSYIYPLGIAEDVLVKVVEHVYPVDFVILDIRENKNRPFILGTPFLTTTKASIKFDTGIITLRSGKSKVSFHRIPDSSNVTDKGVKNDIEPIAPTMTVNRLVLEWEEKIKLHLEREMKVN